MGLPKCDMSSDSPRPYSPDPQRYGSIGEGGEWKEAIDAYYWDHMSESYAMAQALGAGFGGATLAWYRMIEGEALTRETAEILQATEWLTIEFNGTLDDDHQAAIRESCEMVAARLGWNFEMPVRATILVPEADAPWHGGRFGYCIDKFPFDKICLPQRASVHPRDLRELVSHEFTHVITLNLTAGRIPHWLDEGLAVLMEGRDLPMSANWMNPHDLELAFGVDRRDEHNLQHAQEAYAQAVFLVRYLHSLGGDEKFAQLLRAFTNNNLWTEVKINLLGEQSVDEALNEVYGMESEEIFEQANNLH